MRALATAGVFLTCAACGHVDFAGVPRDGSSESSGDATSDASADAAAVCAFDLCEDFEAPLDQSVWTFIDTSAVLDTTVAHRGSKSLHTQLPSLAVGTTGSSIITETKTLSAATTMTPPFWTRAWVRLSALPAGTNALELVSAEQTQGGSVGDYLFVHSTTLRIYSDFDFQEDDTGIVPPLNTWFCVVFAVYPETTNTGMLQLTTDAGGTFTLSATITNGASPIKAIHFGARFAGNNVNVAQPALDLWVDDVIVHSAPVTCAD